MESVGYEVEEFEERDIMIPTVKEFKGDIVIPTYNGECKIYETCTSEMVNLWQKNPFIAIYPWVKPVQECP